ncbi:bifunctional nuclease family protein [Breznakiella homolactica]|uniref:Bifunctional nuclease family protein n=1 Tax=Breznakiella homolactica TaxID=2798577 RepID=A0A7T8BC04_9SPIR|nr:bifunctional nuclease family protein [Breznakiella homolactica]QQO09738.1 bifunctional nuclease family protein [Breznakiella homolactica]
MVKMVEAEIWTVTRTDQGNAVLLRPIGSEQTVPIFIGQLETQSILIGYGNIPIVRPLTHDLLLSVLTVSDMYLDRVEIHDLKNNTFYSRLILQHRSAPGDNPVVIDCRPSDALALAVRSPCPVLISEAVVKQAGVSINLMIDAAENPGDFPEFIPTTEFERVSGNVIDPDPDTRRRKLKAELDLCLAAEEYERAAEIRDLLLLLDSADNTENQKI